MRKLVVLAAVVAGILLAFNYFTTGELTLFPGDSSSEGERQVNQLRGEFREAAREYRQAGREAALSGMDTTYAAEAALAAVDRVEKDLKTLRKTIDESLKGEVDDLLREIKKYKKSLG